MNRVFDSIFVISIPTRIDKVKQVIVQLEILHIDYILWEGHNPNNNNSIYLYSLHKSSKAFKKIGQNEFFLRQTQMDILRYSLKNNFSKILLFEDDIVIANENIIEQFCVISKYLPEWYVLGLGINDQDIRKNKGHYHDIIIKNDNDNDDKNKNKNVENINNTDNSFGFKYIYRNHTNNWGTFAIAFSNKFYKNITDKFDIDSAWPLDGLNAVWKHSDPITEKFLNIYPTIVVPDVRTSELRKEHFTQKFWLDHNSDGFNIENFSQFWYLLFADFDDLKTKTDKIHG